MSLAPASIVPKPDPHILAAVGEQLAKVLASDRRFGQSPYVNFQARRRIEAVIAGLIEALDDLDGEPDREQSACETHGMGFPTDDSLDDAECSDTGLADYGAVQEQYSRDRGCELSRAG